METLIVNILLGSFLVLFAAMAIFPLMMGDRHGSATRKQAASEDRLLRLEHKAILERRSQQPTLVPVPTTDTPRPNHRTAA